MQTSKRYIQRKPNLTRRNAPLPHVLVQVSARNYSNQFKNFWFSGSEGLFEVPFCSVQVHVVVDKFLLLRPVVMAYMQLPTSVYTRIFYCECLLTE